MEVKCGDRGHIIGLVGELDIAAVTELGEKLTELAEHCRAMTLDLSRVTFLDSSGLRLLLDLYRQLHERDVDLRLIEGEHGNVSNVLLRAGMEPLIFRPS